MFGDIFSKRKEPTVVGYDITQEEYQMILDIRTMGKSAFAMQNLAIDPEMYRDYFNFINSSPIDYLRSVLNLKGEKFKEFMEICHAFFVHENQENKVNGMSEWKNVPIAKYISSLEEILQSSDADKYLKLVTCAYRIYFLKHNESAADRKERIKAVLEKRKLIDAAEIIEE